MHQIGSVSIWEPTDNQFEVIAKITGSGDFQAQNRWIRRFLSKKSPDPAIFIFQFFFMFIFWQKWKCNTRINYAFQKSISFWDTFMYQIGSVSIWEPTDNHYQFEMIAKITGSGDFQAQNRRIRRFSSKKSPDPAICQFRCIFMLALWQK